MALSVIDSTHINAGKDLGAAFDEQCYNAGLYDNYAGCGGDDPAYIIRTYHATTLSWRNNLQSVIDLHTAEDPVEVYNFDSAEEAYLRGKFDAWSQEAEMTPLLDPTGVFRAKREALERCITFFDAE